MEHVSACSDRLSDLPKEIKGYILSNLNVEEAVRTSILSSAWTNAWTVMPRIFLSDSSFGSISRFKFVTLVDMVLSLHEGKMVSFVIEGSKSYNDVFDRWMHMLSKKKPYCITIKLTSGPKYKIPSKVFFISVLKYMRLKNCIISLPRGFEGFECLAHLNLKTFSSTDSDISKLICSCPLLISLVLKYFKGLNCLNIRAQELEFLEVEGKFEELHLHVPNLEYAYLTLDKTEVHQSVPLNDGRKSYLKRAFGSLTCIKSLGVSGSFLTVITIYFSH